MRFENASQLAQIAFLIVLKQKNDALLGGGTRYDEEAVTSVVWWMEHTGALEDATVNYLNNGNAIGLTAVVEENHSEISVVVPLDFTRARALHQVVAKMALALVRAHDQSLMWPGGDSVHKYTMGKRSII